MHNRRTVYNPDGNGAASANGDGERPCPNCGCRHAVRVGDAKICRNCGERLGDFPRRE